VQFDPLDLGLLAVVLIVLVGPFMVKKIEHNLEVFLFVMGVLAVTISSFYNKEALVEALGYTEHQVELIGWNMEIVMEAIKEPVVKGIVPAVLFAGLIFHYGKSYVQSAMNFHHQNSSGKDYRILDCCYLGLGFKRHHCHHRLFAFGGAHELHAI